MIKINFLKKEKKFDKKDFTFNADFYWKIILLCATVIILLSFVFSYRFFMQINKEYVLPVVNDNQEFLKISKDRIEKTLNYFSEKEKKSTEILNSPAPVVDPSL